MNVAPARAAARLVTVMAVVLAFCATLLAGGGANAAERRADGLTGYAFDARCAPTQAEMDAWLTSSPFWGVGIYIGGSSASCRPTTTDPGQPHLDATWVAQQRANGWRRTATSSTRTPPGPTPPPTPADVRRPPRR